MIAKTPLTVKGAELLRAELHELKTVQRPAISRMFRAAPR